ncbi:MAG: PEP-CTERM sorting domain-containing protein [Pseudomonadota bacterium]
MSSNTQAAPIFHFDNNGVPTFTERTGSTPQDDTGEASVQDLLNTFGLNDPSFESGAANFIVPTIDGFDGLEFTFLVDTGSFGAIFKYFEVTDQMRADITNGAIEAYRTAARSSAVTIFDDSNYAPKFNGTVSGPGPLTENPNNGSPSSRKIAASTSANTGTQEPTVTPGMELGFLLERAFFNNNGDRIPGGVGSGDGFTLFSDFRAQTDNIDVMLAFSDSQDITLFTFEDNVDSLSDNDYTDLAFRVSPAVLPVESEVPEPSTYLMILSSGAVLLLRQRRRQLQLRDTATS